MGRKGVSKRKPKKSRLIPGTDIGGSSNNRSPVQSLVSDKSAPLNRMALKNRQTDGKKYKRSARQMWSGTILIVWPS
jgi:hypothetical protein